MAKMRGLLGKITMPFPLGRPTWPANVERTIPKSKLGANYDTEWARRYSVRLVRSLITDYVTKPAINIVASPKVLGTDRLKGIDVPVIFAANHASHLDTPLLLSVLPDDFRHKTAVGAGADYFFDRKYKAVIWSFLLGAIPIERTRVSRRSTDLALEILRDDWNLILFPEGGRTPDGFAREFKGGVAQLALKTGSTIVPVFIGGTYEVLGKNKKGFSPGSTVVNFGRPISPSGSNPRDLTKELQSAVNRLGDEVYSDYWDAALRSGASSTPDLADNGDNSWIAEWNRPRFSDTFEDSKKSRWPRLPFIDKPL